MTLHVTQVLLQGMVLSRLFIVLILLSLSALSVGAEDSLGVIYPQVREPFSRVYTDIIQGISEDFDGRVYAFPLRGDLASTIQANEKGRAFDAYVILGNKSLRSINGRKSPIFAVVSELHPDNGITGGILLKPAAEAYLENLLDIYSEVATVHTVYGEDTHEEIVDSARRLLHKRGKTLNAIPASDIRESARAFRAIMSEASPGDGVWLLSDSGLIDSALLDAILDSAWDKRLAVFSSNPSFVKRGALFAIYPDNVAIGRRLARMINSYPGTPATVEYLKDVKVAYNERTGNHIGIKLSPGTKKKIDLILPEF